MKKIHIIFLVTLLLLSSFTFAFSETNEFDRINDNIGLFSYYEKTQLSYSLDYIISSYNIDMVVLADETNDFNNISKECYDFYMNNGYGKGDHNSGIIIYLAFKDSDYEYYVDAYGLYGTAIDYIKYNLFNDVLEKYKDVNQERYYYTITSEFILDVSSILNGTYYIPSSENEDLPEETKDPHKKNNFFIPVQIIDIMKEGLIFGTICGFSISIIWLFREKSKMKTIEINSYAGNYRTDFELTNSADIFLYTTESRVKKESNQNK